MSDDPASIESWQQQMQDDIVTQLRNHIAITTRMHYAKDGFPEPVFVHGPSPICQEAADEIERLRRKLLAEENAYDILRLENERIRDELVSVTNKLNLERDEVCQAWLDKGRIMNEIDCRIEHGADSNGHLESIRSLFKENTNG